MVLGSYDAGYETVDTFADKSAQDRVK
jgi:hypothetical protein